MYNHSGATLSKMLEYLIAKCKFAIGFYHSKKLYNVTIFFVIGPMSDQNYFNLLGHLPNLVGHCPMSNSRATNLSVAHTYCHVLPSVNKVNEMIVIACLKVL
jgi:hypothetical protein